MLLTAQLRSEFNNSSFRMYLPSPQPVDDLEVYINGDISIDSSAAIAPGAIIQAAPSGRIVIKAGACIGMGAVLKAYQGTIEIDGGAILGAGVLVIGHGQIGSNACIGAAATIYNASVEPSAVVPAGSIIGDLSRQVVPTEADAPKSEIEAELIDKPELADNSEKQVDESPPQPSKTPAVGQVYVNNLLLTLFPERNSLNNRHQNNQ